jgi:hypothetical protein
LLSYAPSFFLLPCLFFIHASVPTVTFTLLYCFLPILIPLSVVLLTLISPNNQFFHMQTV